MEKWKSKTEVFFLSTVFINIIFGLHFYMVLVTGCLEKNIFGLTY